MQSKLAGGTDAFVVKIVEALPSPTMQITRFSNGVVISWPTNASGFNLESSDMLAPTSNWSGDTNVPVIAGDQNVVTVEAAASMRFFRLHKQ